MGYIKGEEIVKSDIKIFESSIQLEKYDMYYVEFLMRTGQTKKVRVFCEKGTFPEFDSNEFKRLQQVHGSKILADFFVKRLIGEKGLMNKEGRDDFIYLGGELYKDGYIANRHMIQSNGKTGQQNFDENLSSIKLQVQKDENISQDTTISNDKEENNSQNSIVSNDKEGKTYVIADIHGMYGSYIEIMKRMTPKDHLIILGDVIDRGTGGIQIIQDIMQRKEKQNKQNNPEITFMLGNHEMQFLETVLIMTKRDLHKEDLITIMNRKIAHSQCGFYSLHSDSESKIIQEEWKNKFKLYDDDYQRLIKEKKLTDMELKIIETWLISNKGNTTIFDFLKGGRVNGEKEQNAIYSFLLDSYVALPQNINGKDYLFVHAMPPKDPQMISQMKQSYKGYKITELTREQYGFMLEERNRSTYEQAKAYGFTTICGHTPELGKIIIDDNKGFVRIDAGCGHKRKNSKLVLYCIDDGKVEYFDEKETIHEQECYK